MNPFVRKINEIINETRYPGLPERFSSLLEKQTGESLRSFIEESYDDSEEETVRNDIFGSIRQYIDDAEVSAFCDDSGNLLIYRSLTFDSPDRFIKDLRAGKYFQGYDGLGVCWSFLASGAIAFDGTSSQKTVRLEARININHIDILGSIWCWWRFGNQGEIRLSPGAPLFLTQVTVDDEVFAINQSLQA